MSSAVLLDGRKCQGHANSLSHGTSTKSSPERDGRAGQVTRPTSHTAYRKLAGREAWESPELVRSHSPSGEHCVFKRGLLALQLCGRGASEHGHSWDAGNHKPRVTDFARVKPIVCHVKSFFFFSSTIFHDGFESASIYFLEEKYPCVYICNIDPVLSSTRF